MNHTRNEGVSLSTDQQTVFNWINDELQLPVFAEVYKGALHFLDKKPPGFISFVSHAGRDLMNSLARTVLVIKPGRVPYENLVDELQREWKDEWCSRGFSAIDNTEGGHLVPFKICDMVKNLIDKHREGRLNASEADNLFFTIFLGDDIRATIRRNFFKDWTAARKWFLKHTHVRENEFEIEASSEVVRHFRTLDKLLYVAATSEIGRMRTINAILEKTNE